MIRARESSDLWAIRAHELLDQVQQGEPIKQEHVNWALNYLGDRAGSLRVPADLVGGYDAAEARVEAMHRMAPRYWGAAA